MIVHNLVDDICSCGTLSELYRNPLKFLAVPYFRLKFSKLDLCPKEPEKYAKSGTSLASME